MGGEEVKVQAQVDGTVVQVCSSDIACCLDLLLQPCMHSKIVAVCCVAKRSFPAVCSIPHPGVGCSCSQVQQHPAKPCLPS